MTTLEITQRDSAVPADSLRAQGKVPGVFYGPKEESTPIAFDRLTFDKVFKEAGESTIITLTGVGDDKDTLIQDIDFHPVTGAPLHVDFYVVEKGKKVKTSVPLTYTGDEEALAVKSLGGTLVKVIHEIEIEAMPKDLPHEIVVDLSGLETFESQIAIKDLKVPHGVEVLNNPDDTVVSVAQPREEVEEPVQAIDMDSIEVEKKGKEEAPEDGSAEGPKEESAA